MFVQERLEAIAIRAINEKRVSVKELAKEFGVSEDLIRKDLTVLEKQGRLQKVYGGAVAVRRNPRTPASRQRMSEHEEERIRLSRGCLPLMEEGMHVFLDASLTNVKLAGLIAESGISLTVYTNMIAILNELCTAEAVQVFLFGGKLNEERDAFWSPSAIDAAGRHRYDLAFLGTAGVDPLNGELTTYSESDGILKGTVLGRADSAWCAVETHKFSENGDYRWGMIKDLSGLVIEREADRMYEKQLKKNGVRIRKA